LVGWLVGAMDYITGGVPTVIFRKNRGRSSFRLTLWNYTIWEKIISGRPGTI
jgi:hypothetical protein